ncbi:MAG: radical SAM protein [Halobacteriovoraceae bacterium]|jgi:MoaA/NifB/PqqE/SkfB family radical SAM enzyme|nr:radical SAM protein [Halobacteriovoraceae bacterium]
MASSYSKYKIFHFPKKIQSLKREAPNALPPIHIRIKPLNACDHDCYYCAYRSSNLELGKDMNLKDLIPNKKMQEIIQDISLMGVKSVTFSGGGEPLRYPYMLESLETLVKKKINFAIISNGSNLQGKLADIISQHASWIRISLDGWDAKSYANYRNVSLQEFDKVIKNLERFKQKSPRCKLSVNLIVNKDNAPHIEELVLKLKKIGIDNIKIGPCVISNDHQKNYAYHQPIALQVKQSIVKLQKNHSSSNFELINGYNFTPIENMEKKYSWCPYVQVLPVIGADLMVYTCQDKAYTQKGVIGSIKDISFKEFWLNNKDKFYRITPSKDCHHNCVAHDKNKMLIDFLDISNEDVNFV